MATLVRCDRCKVENVQIIQVLGRDLCNTCREQFSAWVDAGVEPSPQPRRVVWYRRLRDLTAGGAELTPDMLASVYGCSRRNAHDVLRWYKGQGVLSQVRVSTFVWAEDSNRKTT